MASATAIKERAGYLGSSLVGSLSTERFRCTSCGGDVGEIVAHKHLVTQLRRCRRCQLMYRTPSTPADAADAYYQEDYQSGLTTDLPSPSDLEALKARQFAGTEKDFARYLRLLGALGRGPGGRLLDFGSSWGYGAWQFQNAGFEVKGFELSRPRARYAVERLGMEISTSLAALAGEDFDVFFSSHVLEHVPQLGEILAFARERLAARKGLFVAITPNGSADRRRADPQRWQRAWGFRHPNLLDEVFWKTTCGQAPFLITTDLETLEPIRSWREGGGQTVGRLDGGELLLACRF